MPGASPSTPTSPPSGPTGPSPDGFLRPESTAGPFWTSFPSGGLSLPGSLPGVTGLPLPSVSYSCEAHPKILKAAFGQTQWLTPVIPALWEAKVGRSQITQDQVFKTSLANMAKPRLYQNTKISWMWWHAPVILATQEAEAGELLETGRWRLQ